ncbi:MULTISPECIES: thiamine pyrophosphate-binding protein [Mesorhizobium]|uniref:Acetolactate synthase n=2 Tax=Mesorhizobium TaxID=68287 RepID=A0A1A5IB04_RHILI|nr:MULTISPECIES: thiamine pyrophosphate-binding protein [Mesorhizobium]ETA71302.1 thiamine pyrophosphate-dependent enzyme, putative carboligase or decarboxylase [Mesorhizobium japonicum R7A]MBE1711459.1 thiamine pyrophosphate-binding protein [Mesorhizobium japonicum]MBE1717748.1 thiamine pyrophosphate-binding protein [Mesorhizobium japonicum]MUT23655.1 thiamine pyrophosphate-binding protein [Mesorhizobium japonicum]MUT30447.1 thiamine pyrophosphate-binding protein [Mesorhizobium japonicum]
MKLTGGQIVARALKEYGVEYVAGVPGHGIWSLFDAFLEEGSTLPFIQVMHEQSAVHMADGFFRASGRPMACSTSIGPGATNTIIGLATCYADSIPAFFVSGGPATHMKGHGVMQEIERQNENAFPRITEQVTKRAYKAGRVDELPFIMHRAFNTMLSGRPGPVHVEVPMDIQVEAADVEIHPLDLRMARGVSYPDPKAVERAVKLLLSAERPVIVAGGGAISANASGELTRLAEKLGAAVSITWNGKGAISEDHALFIGAVGQTGTTCGNSITASADVVMSVGCRFTDWSASSYAKGVSFSIPPGKLIHIDLDHHEIGKNYPTEVGIVADAKATLEAMLAMISEAESKKAVMRRDRFLADVQKAKADWEALLAPRRDSRESPFTSQRPLGALRTVMSRDGIVVVGSGNTQGAVKQTFPIYQPRTHLTSGSFSPMGWAVPAAMGAKLAMPDRQVVSITGDGDFMMSLPELGTAVMNNIPVVFLVQNNQGYMSIRGGQRKFMGRHIASEFNRHKGNGEPYSADIAAVARNFGVESWKVTADEDLEKSLKAALDCGGPALVEVITSRDAAGPFATGWWDFPSPAYYEKEQAAYTEKRVLEQHM